MRLVWSPVVLASFPSPSSNAIHIGDLQLRAYGLMIALGVGLELIQEAKADSAAATVKAMISVTATVVRGGAPLEVAVSHRAGRLD